MIPKIAVIIPVYNAEKMIERCLNSLLYQIFEDFTVFIINDGSTDNTLDVIQSFVEKDTRFKIFTQDNQGASVARNVGYSNSVSEFVTFVDADDTLAIDALGNLYEHISKYNNDYVIGAKKKVNAKGKTVDFLPELFEKKIGSISPSNIEVLKKVRLHIAPHAKLIRRSFLEENEIKFVEHWTYEDFLYSYMLLLNATSIGIVANTCYYYIANSDSISNKPLRTHNILSRWEIEKLLWRLCSIKDHRKVIYHNPQSTTFRNRFYRHIGKIGLMDDTVHENAFYSAKEIVQKNIQIITNVTLGIKKIIYLAIYYLEFDEFYKFRQEVERSQNEFISLQKGNIDVTGRASLEVGLSLMLKVFQKHFKDRFGLNKIWIYKEQVLVLDFILEKNKIAFDIKIDEKKNILRVWMLSRNKPKSLICFKGEVLSFLENKYLIVECSIDEIEKPVKDICVYLDRIKGKI